MDDEPGMKPNKEQPDGAIRTFSHSFELRH